MLFATWTFSFSLGNLLLVIVLLFKKTFIISGKQIGGLILLISCLSLLNIFLGVGNVKILDSGSSSLSLFIPYLSLLIASYLIGNSLNVRVIRYIILLTIFESLVTCWQFSTGRTGFWYNSYQLNTAHADLLYFTRPNGLSGNSSIVAQKVLISTWALLRGLSFGKVTNFSFIVILGIAGVVLFNRTVILTILFGLIISKEILSPRLKLYGFMLSLPFAVKYGGDIFRQLFRGSDTVQLESFSRFRIYRDGWNFILENPVLGNNSVKYFYLEGGRQFHLHNSYLEVLASNGIVIGGLCFMLLFLVRKNPFVLPVVIYSVFQFGAFWGLSFFDVILFYNDKRRN